MRASHWPASIVSAVATASFSLASLGGSDALGAPTASKGAAKPTVSVSYAKPTRTATVRVTFAGTAPPGATVSARMAMLGETHVVNRIPLKQTGDPHTLQATLRLSMSGAWTIQVIYGNSREIDIPLKVRS